MAERQWEYWCADCSSRLELFGTTLPQSCEACGSHALAKVESGKPIVREHRKLAEQRAAEMVMCDND